MIQLFRQEQHTTLAVAQMLFSCVYLFAQAIVIFKQIIYSVGFLSLLCNLFILARQGKIWEDVDHDLGETVSQ